MGNPALTGNCAFPKKSEPTETLLKSFLMVLPSSPIEGKLVKGFLSYDRTYKKQTNRDYNLTAEGEKISYFGKNNF